MTATRMSRMSRLFIAGNTVSMIGTGHFGRWRPEPGSGAK
jgi:hypothetical protein